MGDELILADRPPSIIGEMDFVIRTGLGPLLDFVAHNASMVAPSRRADQPATSAPPSTVSVAPVIHGASSDARKSAA